MTDFNTDERLEKFDFAQINQLNKIPRAFIDDILNINANVYETKDLRTLKETFLDKIKSEDEFEDILNYKYVKKLIALFNTDNKKNYFNYITSFFENKDEVTYRNANLIFEFITDKRFENCDSIFTKVDAKKLTENNIDNFSFLNKVNIDSYNNLEFFYIDKKLSEYIKRNVSLLLTKKSSENLDVVMLKLLEDDPKYFEENLDKIRNFNEKYDMSFLTKLPVSEIQYILDNDELYFACKSKNIDYKYITDKYPGISYIIKNAIAKNINIEDIYKNGYNEDLLKAIIKLRENNLSQYEYEIINFSKENFAEEELSCFIRFLLEIKPNHELIEAFKKYFKENTFRDTDEIVRILKSKGLSYFEHPEKLFTLGEKESYIFDFYDAYDVDFDFTAVDLNDYSENFLDRALYSYEKGYPFEKIFSDEFKKYDDLVYEALFLNESKCEIPEERRELIDKFKEVSNKEYEMLLNFYNREIIDLDRTMAKKLEYLIKYKNEVKDIIIDDLLDKDLRYIENMLKKELEK